MTKKRLFGNVALWSVALMGFPIHTPANNVPAPRMEEVSTVVMGSGPFEVAGEPSSYAVAWVDTGSGADTLSLSLFRTGESPVVRQVATHLDRRGRLFLEKTGATTIVAWKARDGWRVGQLTVTPDGGATFVETVLHFARSNQPIAMSFDGQRVLLLVGAGDELAVERDHGVGPQKSRVPVVEIPDLAGPTLVAIDLEARAATVLQRIVNSIGAAAIAPTSDGPDVAFVDPATGRVEILHIDMTGSIRSGSSLGWAVSDSTLALHETDGATLIGWTEERGDGSVTMLARAGHTSTEVVTEVVSSPGRTAHGLVMSGGDGTWAAWSETSDQSDEIVVGAWSDSGNLACRTSLPQSAPVERTWLLSQGARALLFVQSETPGGTRRLNVMSLTCGPLSDDADATAAGGASGLIDTSGGTAAAANHTSAGTPATPESPLAGASEPCDGYDNDGNGILDDGCDRVCDAPQKAASETRLTNHTGVSARPSGVWTGSGYGVAWADSLDGTADSEIYFARLDTSGNTIGPDVRVTSAAGTSNVTSLAWTGNGYGVSWSDIRTGDWEIWFARLDTSGNKIGSDVQLTISAGESGPSKLVWTGSGYGVAWHDWRDGNAEIYFARLDAAGNKIGSDVRVTSDGASSVAVSLAWTGSSYGVAWRDTRHGYGQIYFARIDAAGNKIGSDVRVTNTTLESAIPSLVWTGNEYGVVWDDNRDGNFEIYFARIDAAGNKIGSDVRVTNDPYDSVVPSLGWTGGDYGVSWSDYRNGNSEIYFARLDAAGSKLGSDVRVTSAASHSEYPALVWTGREHGVSWQDYRDGNYEIYFARIACCDDADADGYSECSGDTNDQDSTIHPGAIEVCDARDNDSDGVIDEGCDTLCDASQKAAPETRVTVNTADSMQPSLVWTGSNYGLAWRDFRDANLEIYFARLDGLGNRIGADARLTNDGAFSNSPSLVWTGSEYGVSWYDDRDGNYEIYFARLDAAGVKIGGDVRVTSALADSSYPSLVWTGSEYGVSWQDFRDGNWEIYFTRIDAAGNKIGGDVRVTNAVSSSSEPSLVWTGSGYGLSWSDGRDGGPYELYFARLDAAGVKIGADVRVTNAPASSDPPSLVWTGSEYGVSWHDWRDGNAEIYFARLDASGTKLGADLRVTNATLESGNPSLVWTGSEYGVSWNDRRDGNYETYFARLGTAGTKIDADMRVTSAASDSIYPSLVWTGSEYAVLWQDARDGNTEIYFARIACCDDADADGYSECSGDTNDQDSTIHPGALEVCDGRDNNSDGVIDEGCDTLCDAPQKAAPDTRVTLNSADSTQPSLAWTGSNYGSAWQDLRDANFEIYFARLDTSGNKIGSDVRVTNNIAASAEPSVVWTGTVYGVSWHDFRDGNYEIYFARLDAGGNKIGSDVRVTNAVGDSVSPSLVWTGSEYGVSWHDVRDGNYEIYFARLDAGGNKIGSDVRVTNAVGNSAHASLVWTGSQYGVSWHDDRVGNWEIYFAHLNGLGTKIGSDVRVTSAATDSLGASMVWTGGEYGVSWHDWRDGNAEIYFARLDASGTKLGADVRVTNAVLESGNPSLVWTGSEYGVSWNERRDGNYETYFARLGTAGTKIGTDVRVTSAALDSIYPSLVWTGSAYGVSWQDARDGNTEIYFARIVCCDDADADGYSECAGDTNDQDSTIHPGALEVCDGRDNNSDGVIDEGCDTLCDSPEKFGSDIRVTNNIAQAWRPSLVWTGSESGVSWYDDRDGNFEIYFARLDASGAKIGSDVRVTSAAGNSVLPSLVWTGSEYGVAWHDNRDGNYEIYFARLDASGTKIGLDVRVTNDIAFSQYPSLVWTGSEYGVAWHDNRDGNYEIYFARLDALGNKIGAEVRLTNAASNSLIPSLVWTGSAYGVSWYNGGNFEIYFARVDASGNKVGSDVRVTNNPANSESPSLVWTGSEYGMSWYDDRDGNYEIYFARVDASGTKIGSDVRVTSDTAYSVFPSLVWTGSEYGVSWDDLRDGNYETYFARLNGSGNKVGSDMRVTNAAVDSLYSSLAWTGSEYGVAWQDARDGNFEIYFARIACCDNLDGDAYNECHDCNDGDGSVWAIPGEVRSLVFPNKSTLSWTAPGAPGCAAPRYDTVRSNQASVFTTGAVCVETDDASNSSATDATTPAGGAAFYYLVRAGNTCGEGSSGRRSDDQERDVRSCP